MISVACDSSAENVGIAGMDGMDNDVVESDGALSALGLGGAAPAQALTRTHADRIALRALATSPISGIDGISASPVGFAIISTFHSAEIEARAGSLTVTS